MGDQDYVGPLASAYQDVKNNRKKDKDEEERKKKNEMGRDTLLLADSPEGRELESTFGSAEPDPDLFLEDRQSFADEARKALSGIESPSEYDRISGELTDDAGGIGIDEDRFNRFLNREDLKRPGIDPEAEKMSNRSLAAEEAGFGGLAELYRAQSDSRIGRTPLGSDRSAQPLAGRGRALKSEMDSNTPNSRLLREATSMRRRGHLGMARALEGKAMENIGEDLNSDYVESDLHEMKLEISDAENEALEDRYMQLATEERERLLTHLEQMNPEDRSSYIRDYLGKEETAEV